MHARFRGSVNLWFATLLVALVGIAVPKFWPLELTSTDTAWQTWFWSWAAGGLALGLAVAAVWTYCVRRDAMAAAILLHPVIGALTVLAAGLVLVARPDRTREQLVPALAAAIPSRAAAPRSIGQSSPGCQTDRLGLPETAISPSPFSPGLNPGHGWHLA